jgi:hypothetical protein
MRWPYSQKENNTGHNLINFCPDPRISKQKRNLCMLHRRTFVHVQIHLPVYGRVLSERFTLDRIS